MKKEEQSFGCGISVSQKGHALSGWILRIVPLFVMLFATVAAKAAGDGDGVKFNPGVRYSQWAINSRAHDFYANSTAFGLAKYKADGTSVEIKRNDTKKKLDYVPGLVAKSMIEAADYYQNFDWSKPWFASVKEYGDAYYNSVPNGGGSLDDLNAVKLYIGIYNYKNASATDKTNAQTAIGRATEGLIAHNKNNSIQSGTLAGDAVVGGWFHKEAYNNQMWLDGAYMGSALLAQIVNFNGAGSNVFGSADKDWEMVVKQLNIVWNMCWNSTDKLMYHAFEANAGTGTSKSHADTWAGLNGKTEPYTFHSAAYWGRANAWYIFALVDALEAMDKAGRTTDANYTTLQSHLKDLAAGIVACQTSDGGWYQLLDKDNTFTATSYNSNWSGKPSSATNYIETSATAIFSAALFKAVRLGLIDAKYKENAKKAFECLVNNYTYLKDGSLEIWGSCRSAGLGGGTGNDYAKGGKKYRDGSNEYYLLGYDVPMVKKKEGLTEGKVLGGFIMAATEYERAYQNQDNASQILFSYDLKPAYDLTQSGATAPKVEVCGTGAANATYQWYDATTKVAVEGATEAQFIPQTTGNYYCKATVDNTSIQTSATNIKVNSNSSADKQKFTVTATAVNGTVEIKDGADNVVTSGTQVEEGTKLIFTAKANTGYVFDSWTATGGEASDNVYTISSIAADVNVKANFKKENTGGGDTGGETTTETVFSMVTTAESDVSVASGDTKTLDGNADKTGGSAELYNGKSSATVMISKTEGVKLNGSRNSYMKVTLNKPLAKGDVIAAPDCGSSFYVTSADTKTTDAPEVNATGYTIPENSDLIGKTVIYFWSGKGKSITITRKTTTQTTSPLVIAVENVEMNVTDEETLQPEVRVYGIGDKLLTLGTDYKLSFSTDNDNVTINDKGVFTAAGSQFNYTEGVTHVTVTATPSEKLAGQYTKATEDFTFTVRKGKMKPEFMSAFNATTIKVAKGTKKTIEVPLNYGGEDVSGYFDVGYTCSALPKLSGSNNKMTYTFGAEGKYQITVSATPKIINQGTDTEFDYSQEYDAPDAVTFTVDVKASYAVPVVTLNPSAAKTIYVGEVVDAPAVSVTESGTAIDNSKYTMEWTSFAPDVCKVDATTGKIEGVSAGDNVKIQVAVSGDGFEDVFSYILVSVDDPAKYRVKATGSGEKYSPMTPLFNQNKTLAVTLGGWSFTDRQTAPVSKEGLTYGENNKWAGDSSPATWLIKGFDYYLSGITCQNARQEDGACPLPSETQWYDGKLQKVKGGTVDPMFYVPCSGAYLTVEPKTNGKVSVSVFQNGVFDKSGGVYAYRPQRRVFVLDEAGKVVASEATISATGGKLTVADKNATTDDLKDPYKITNYPCNIAGLASGPSTTGGGKKNSNPSPTIEDVKNHFRGMTSFEMTATGFQNNVYESNIDNKVTWGSYATPNNGADDNVKGSHGWSVLVDAAVTYTFDVKAGKTYYIYNYGSKLGFYGFSFDEAKGQTVKNYEFDEAAANTIELTKAGELTTAKVNRAMAAGVWTTCVLPFSLNKQQVDAIFGKTYDRDTPNGTQILYFDRVEGTKAIFVRHAYNNIVAGKPFLIKPAQDVASINTAEVEGYPYVTIENTQPAEWCKGNGYVWMSSYSNGLTVKEGDCFISNKDGSFKNFVGDPGTLKGFRGYLKNIGTNGVSEAKKLTVGMGSNVTTDETSAIDGILIDGDMPADSVTAADGKVYNLNGQVVATSYRQFQALPGGVYVVNGKKVVK